MWKVCFCGSGDSKPLIGLEVIWTSVLDQLITQLQPLPSPAHLGCSRGLGGDLTFSHTRCSSALASCRVKAAFLTEIRPVLSPDLWLLCKNQGGLKVLWNTDVPLNPILGAWAGIEEVIGGLKVGALPWDRTAPYDKRLTLVSHRWWNKLRSPKVLWPHWLEFSQKLPWVVCALESLLKNGYLLFCPNGESTKMHDNSWTVGYLKLVFNWSLPYSDPS